VHSERNELQGQLNKIQRQHEPALKRIDEKLSSLSQERTSALDRIGTILGKRTQVRQTTADLLNSRLPENVNVRIMPLADDTAYFTFLSSTVLAGLGIRNRERHIQTLVSSFPPRTLANLIRSKNEDAVTAAGISPDATSKLLALPEEEVERIEECLLEDKPVISLRREGHADFSSLDQLSIGEKCSVILSLMLSSGDHPLIIDEPEAELDHEFICSSVVESIRSAKGKRQVLVCTHNPNIPVLGDAELVIKVTKVPGEPRCRVEHAAGFEDEQSIYFLKQLEGGEAALRKRSTKYQLASS
jgi:ABC-type dipeptide/oligopeptide/nickel transport system ATPase component